MSKNVCAECSGRLRGCWVCGMRFCSNHIFKSSKREGCWVCAKDMPQHEGEPVVWRANIKTAGKADPYKFAVDHSVCGGQLAARDFIWNRDNDGFWLGRVTGGWRYDQTGTEADIDCKWMKVSGRDVPRRVRSCNALYRFVTH